MHTRFRTPQQIALAAALAAAACWHAPAAAMTPEQKAKIEQGRQIAFDRARGNCLACHMIAGGEDPGNIGPPLIAMAQRYPDKAKLRAQIWDAHVANPESVMPPFGRNQILTEEEIDAVVEFIYVQ